MGVLFVMLFGCAAAAIAAYRILPTWNVFALRHYDVRGVTHAAREQIDQILHEETKQGLWQVDVDSIRDRLRHVAWVREAEVACVLPDTLRVTVIEREPLALARLHDGSVVWVDREGNMLGDQSGFKPSRVPPLISGLDENVSAAAIAANRERLDVYQKLLADLDRENDSLSDRVDEVHLDEISDVRLRLGDRRVMILVGSRDFRARLQTALKVLDAADRQDVTALGFLKVTDAKRLLEGGEIAYLNASRAERVIVGLAH
jgi:cell division protein FtsQ